MKAELKEISPLVPTYSLEEFWPDDESNFALPVRLMIGTDDSVGADSFDILVCTPDWIKSQYAEEKCVWGRHMLIVLEYDFDLIKREIERYIATCTGEDWETIAQKLSRIGSWEFEDYQPYRDNASSP